MRKKDDWWWDASWNPVGGCKAISPGCTHCYAAQHAGTYTWRNKTIHTGVTVAKEQRRIFNGALTELPAGHHLWKWPLKLPRAEYPALGAGQPSLIFVGDMSDLFHEDRPTPVIDHVVATIALSEHIGLLVTKRTARMAEYFSARKPKADIWLGFSAERQVEFDLRWAHMRPLAEAGWLVFVSIGPMLRPVKLPPDFLALGGWAIVAGEQGAHRWITYMEPDWARAVRDQCAAANLPFFMKQMSHGKPIPPDLHIRQFPCRQIDDL